MAKTEELIVIDRTYELVKWFVSLAESPMRIRFEERHPGLGKRLDALLKQHRRRLLRTAGTCGATERVAGGGASRGRNKWARRGVLSPLRG
jgi:hypothetical protein